MRQGLEDEFDIVRLDGDGFVNVTGVVSPPPETMEEANRIIREMLEDDPTDRLAIRTRKATPWELIRWVSPS